MNLDCKYPRTGGIEQGVEKAALCALLKNKTSGDAGREYINFGQHTFCNNSRSAQAPSSLLESRRRKELRCYRHISH